MYEVSARFRQTIVGSHLVAVRVQLLTTIQFGAAPTGGIELPLLGGGLSLNSTADIKGSLRVQVPADYWDAVQPYGVELFVERGVDFGDGTREMVPLGYYRVEDADQPNAPFGPVDVLADDRTASLQQVRVIYPYQIPAGTSHRTIMSYLVNGVESGQGTYGMFPSGPEVPIDWTDAGYDPDAAFVADGITVDDSAYEFLAKLVDSKGALITFKPTGEMAIVARDRGPEDLAVTTVRPGDGGTFIRASRRTTRQGVYNMVRATGSDPGYATGYRLAYINDGAHPLRWYGPFGAAVRYYASPLLRTSEAAAEAAQTMLARSTGLPTERSLWTVPDPSLQVLDKINSIGVDGETLTHIIDGIDVPLVGGAELAIRTRTTNPVGQVDTDPDPAPNPDPEDPEEEDPGSGDPGGGPGGTPDPADGTQAAVLNGWGAVVFGDEFNYTGSPDPAKWGLYNGPGHAGNGLRRPSAFAVANGVGVIHGENGTSGGAAFRRGEYGYRVECRARVYNTAGGTDRFHPVLILWPDSDQWPQGAEYDFFETDEGTGEFGLFMHLPNHQPYRQDHYSEDLDIQNWHNYACEWNPAARTLRAWVDGRRVYNGQGRVAEAPGPMHLTWQLDHFGGNPRPCNFELAWVRGYTRPNA